MEGLEGLYYKSTYKPEMCVSACVSGYCCCAICVGFVLVRLKNSRNLDVAPVISP